MEFRVEGSGLRADPSPSRGEQDGVSDSRVV